MGARGRPRDTEVEGKVLEAAVAELRQRGYAGLSMDRVAERAGVAKTTIYRRWSSKAELVVALITHLREDVAFEPGDDPRRDLTGLVTAIAARLTSTPTTLIADLAAAAARDPRISESVRTLWAARHQAVTEVVAKAQQDGLVLAHVAPAVLVDQLVGPLYYRLLVTGEPLTPDYARTLVASVLGPALSDHTNQEH